jgi:hypothetical protein
MIVYNEPSGSGDATIRLSEDDAIKRAKEYAARKGYVYSSDADALGDFMVIHWARKE